ncbi:PLP-dependent aminotransferase family protein [Janibacter sp. GS2]|uniref:MocR-like pyridoxine biosynthesis transcription factor PdxR n=1 Tax=Janibacter sp. GS2 TaxID=3442646 RepID=UPI003EB87DCB
MSPEGRAGRGPAGEEEVARLPVTNLLDIDADSPVPLYRQLRQALECQIVSGTFDPGLPLPSSRELARELGVSRNTVNAAYEEFLAEGMVVAHPRRGLFINPDLVAGSGERGLVDEVAIDWSRHLVAPLDAALPEITKARDWMDHPYPFVAGQVNPADFPRLAWARSLRQALDPPHLHFSLRDSVDEDDPFLLEMLCRKVLPSRGIDVTPEHVLITSGSQHGLDLLAATMIRPGDAVGVEDPGYTDARHRFAVAGAHLVPFPVDEDGIVPDRGLDGLRLLHVTPSHHSPTNVTLSGERRQRLIALADESDTLIVEDDYDAEFRYHGKPTPALKARPQSGRVIYLGSFTKFFAPGLRLGYLVAEPDLIAELRRRRRYLVRHVSGHQQRGMALLLEAGQYQRTIRRRRSRLSRKWTELTTALAEELPSFAGAPPGGVSIWVRGPEGLDCSELADLVLEDGVVIERGDVFFFDPVANAHHFRLGFAAIEEEAIRPGVRLLSAGIRELTR